MTKPLVVVTPYGRLGGSSRVRVFDWLAHLGEGAEVLDYTGLADNSAGTIAAHPQKALAAECRLRRVGRPQRLIICREASPFSRGRLEARMLQRAGHGVYDFDDALFHDCGRWLRSLLGKAEKCRSAVSAADRVIAGNEYLAEWAQRRAKDVVVVPSCVRPDDYRQKTSWTVQSTPRLIWLGSASTEQYVKAVSEPLMMVHRITGARLTMISNRASSLGPLDAMVDRVGWSIDAAAEHLSTADVAIGPLIDTPFARGKCAYKLLQYAATGLPIVGTPVGSNAIALERFMGVQATTVDEWREGLLTLIAESQASLEHRGRSAVEAVRRHYSFEAWEETWRRAVEA